MKILGGGDDFDLKSGALIGLALLRLRARELCGWFGVKDKIDALRHQDKGVLITLFPESRSRCGGSGALPMLLAMIRLFFGVELQPKLAATGVLTLLGGINKVSNIVGKIKAAVKVGAEIILVPKDNKEDVEAVDEFEGKERIEYVECVVQAFEVAVKDKFTVRTSVSMSP